MTNTGVPYFSANRTNAKPFDRPARRFPLPIQSPVRLAAYAFDQGFEMLLASFPPAPFNTPSNAAAFGLSDANAILTDYSRPNPTGASLGKSTATFSIVPASWDDFKPIPFTFPGFPGFLGTANARDIFTDVVLARFHYDYFLVDPSGLCGAVKDSSGTTLGALDAAGSNRVSALSKIPVINKSNFYTLAGGSTMRTNSIVPAGGKIIGTTLWLETLPNLALYQAWQAKAVASAWTSTVWDGVATAPGTVGQIVAQDSQLVPYAGNIMARETVYVLVK